ncbi:uncharacterized protein LTR77_004421 [Saxophila tyrrhenica]|uniref:Uncharacterized protein n=1 Tax=Saxophila tyrrhenica TaxID=1690608 RepID=A0AAV9PFM7_9PEZI|nr:hypothetical protein LTR77_004421 [Saxophila tyrrhenica]
MCIYTTPTTWACDHTTGTTQFESLCDHKSYLRKNSMPFERCSPPTGPAKMSSTAFCEACTGLLGWCKGLLPASMIVGQKAFHTVGTEAATKHIGKGFGKLAKQAAKDRQEEAEHEEAVTAVKAQMKKDIKELEQTQKRNKDLWPESPDVQEGARLLPQSVENVTARASRTIAEMKVARQRRLAEKAQRAIRKEEKDERMDWWCKWRLPEIRNSGGRRRSSDVGDGFGGCAEGGAEEGEDEVVVEREGFREPFPLFLPVPALGAGEEGTIESSFQEYSRRHGDRNAAQEGSYSQQPDAERWASFPYGREQHAEEQQAYGSEVAWQEAEAAWQAAGGSWQGCEMYQQHGGAYQYRDGANMLQGGLYHAQHGGAYQYQNESDNLQGAMYPQQREWGVPQGITIPEHDGLYGQQQEELYQRQDWAAQQQARMELDASVREYRRAERRMRGLDTTRQQRGFESDPEAFLEQQDTHGSQP